MYEKNLLMYELVYSDINRNSSVVLNQGKSPLKSIKNLPKKQAISSNRLSKQYAPFLNL